MPQQPPDQTLRDLQEELSIFRSLQEHPGYKRLMDIAAKQIQARMMELMTPCGNQDQLIKMEFNKGAITGLRIMTEMVSYHMDTVKDLMQREERANEPDSSDDD